MGSDSMRFCSINIYSGESSDGNTKKALTKMLRHDSDPVVNAYLQSFKYYDNKICISLNISCDEAIDSMFIEEFAKGYPILHMPFDLDAYLQIAECERSDFWFDAVCQCIAYVGGVWHWDAAFFEDVRHKCLLRLENR